MKRRGILGMFGAGAAAAAAPGPLAGTAAPGSPMALGAARVIGGDFGGNYARAGVGGAEVAAAAKINRQFGRIERRNSLRRHARERQMTLCGGHAPHVASCHSWSPWFRAQVSVAWQMRREAEERAAEQSFLRGLAGTITDSVTSMLPGWLHDRIEEDD